MKKVVVIVVCIILLMFLVSCVNYKTENTESTEVVDQELLNEIAKIEQELESEKENTSEEKALENPELEVSEIPTEESETQEVILPELTEEPAEFTDEAEMQVLEVNENEMVKLNVKVSDPDQDKVEYSFTPPLNKVGQWKTNYGDAGDYIVTLTATDGVLTTEKMMKIVVNRVNVAPLLSGVADLQVDEGELVSFKPVASDPNGDQVTVTISEPLQSGSFATDHTSAGEYQVKVVASDGELSTEKSLVLVVHDVNELPVLTNLQDLVVKEGETITLQPTVSDLDEDDVRVTISEPVGNSGVWKTLYTDHGEYVVTVTANDGKGIVTKQVKLSVEDVNMPPEIVEVKLVVS